MWGDLEKSGEAEGQVSGNQNRSGELICEVAEPWPFSFFRHSIQNSDSWGNVPEKSGLDSVLALWARLGDWIDGSWGKSGCSDQKTEWCCHRSPLSRLSHAVSLENKMTSGCCMGEGRPVCSTLAKPVWKYSFPLCASSKWGCGEVEGLVA